MPKNIIVFFLGLMIFFGVAENVNADYILSTTDLLLPLGNFGNNLVDREISQSFTTGSAGTIQGISIGLRDLNTVPGGDSFQIKIVADNGGVPSFGTLQDQTPLNSSLPNGCALYNFSLIGSLELSATTTYWITSRPLQDYSVNSYQACGSPTNVYSGGGVSVYDFQNDIWTASTSDMALSFYVDVANEPPVQPPTPPIPSIPSAPLATSTVDQVQDNYFFGNLLFLIAFFATVFIFKPS